MEEKIYERQVTKQAISKRVIDEQQIDRHYAESDLAELYTFCPVPEGAREVPKLPKDRLFADLFKAHDATVIRCLIIFIFTVFNNIFFLDIQIPRTRFFTRKQGRRNIDRRGT